VTTLLVWQHASILLINAVFGVYIWFLLINVYLIICVQTIYDKDSLIITTTT